MSNRNRKLAYNAGEYICHCCAILDMYAPCRVSYQTWNDDANMNPYCCTTDQKLFNANVLLVSDEAFLL